MFSCYEVINFVPRVFQVPSPFKKRRREEENVSRAKRRRSSAEKQAATCNFFKTENDGTVPNPLEDRLKEIAAKTRDKLQGFAATDIETLLEDSSSNIAEFDFSVLRREKAAAVSDIDIHRNDQVVTNRRIDKVGF